MRIWRICRARFAGDALKGEGSRLYGGRWNSPGVRMVYASTSLALAALETFVNLEPNLRPYDLVSIDGEIADALRVKHLDAKLLPANWHRGGNESLRRLGDEWVHRGDSVALLVPSAAVRGERNVLINPVHPDFARVKFKKPRPFEFDLRMFR